MKLIYQTICHTCGQRFEQEVNADREPVGCCSEGCAADRLRLLYTEKQISQMVADEEISLSFATRNGLIEGDL